MAVEGVAGAGGAGHDAGGGGGGATKAGGVGEKVPQERCAELAKGGPIDDKTYAGLSADEQTMYEQGDNGMWNITKKSMDYVNEMYGAGGGGGGGGEYHV